MSFRDRGSTPMAGASRRLAQSRGGASIGSAILSKDEGSLGNSMSMKSYADGNEDLRPHSRSGGTMMPSQSEPVLGRSHENGNRASTAPSSQDKRGRRVGAGRNLGSRVRQNKRSFTTNAGSGSRPSTAPLRMIKRPGTAVRTRGFFDDYERGKKAPQRTTGNRGILNEEM